MVSYLTDDSFLEPQGQPFINGCFNWMLPNLNIENGCFTKHPFINGCLRFKVVIVFSCLERAIDSTGHLQKKTSTEKFTGRAPKFTQRLHGKLEMFRKLYHK